MGAYPQRREPCRSWWVFLGSFVCVMCPPVLPLSESAFVYLDGSLLSSQRLCPGDLGHVMWVTLILLLHPRCVERKALWCAASQAYAAYRISYTITTQSVNLLQKRETGFFWKRLKNQFGTILSLEFWYLNF